MALAANGNPLPANTSELSLAANITISEQGESFNDMAPINSGPRSLTLPENHQSDTIERFKASFCREALSLQAGKFTKRFSYIQQHPSIRPIWEEPPLFEEFNNPANIAHLPLPFGVPSTEENRNKYSRPPPGFPPISCEERQITLTHGVNPDSSSANTIAINAISTIPSLPPKGRGRGRGFLLNQLSQLPELDNTPRKVNFDMETCTAGVQQMAIKKDYISKFGNEYVPPPSWRRDEYGSEIELPRMIFGKLYKKPINIIIDRKSKGNLIGSALIPKNKYSSLTTEQQVILPWRGEGKPYTLIEL